MFRASFCFVSFKFVIFFICSVHPFTPPPTKIGGVYPFMFIFIYTGKDLVMSACNSNAIQILVPFFFVVIKFLSINPLKCSFHMREESCIQDSSVSFTQSILLCMFSSGCYAHSSCCSYCYCYHTHHYWRTAGFRRNNF